LGSAYKISLHVNITFQHKAVKNFDENPDVSVAILKITSFTFPMEISALKLGADALF
jgi:hypothetical protein